MGSQTPGPPRGVRTEAEMVRPVARLEQLSYYRQLCERVTSLAEAGVSAAQIAESLNTEGFRPPKRRDRFGVRHAELLEG